MVFSDGGLLGVGNLHEEAIRNVVAVTVPEPTGVVLVGVGAALLLGWRLFNKRRQ